MARGWVVKKLDWSELRAWLADAPHELTLPTGPDPDEMANALNNKLVELCDHTIPRRSLMPGRKSVHWWSNEIAALHRASCRTA